MANPEHLEILKQGAKVWNEWREEHREVIPDLEDTDLEDADLLLAILREAYLIGADLSSAVLIKADLSDARLSSADLRLGGSLG